MILTWHEYKYHEYERELARREVMSLLSPDTIKDVEKGIDIGNSVNHELIDRLVYFSSAQYAKKFRETTQSRLEKIASSGARRQSTRYSVHGLHEYKGKFNPQVARCLLNIFKIDKTKSVLDPFCGSGTTLVESAHLGISCTGLDINPFAVYLSNAKLLALSTPFDVILVLLRQIENRLGKKESSRWQEDDAKKRAYLLNWFEVSILDKLEHIRAAIYECAGDVAPVFLVIVSNILRDYSEQDPNDLRIRKRKTPLPSIPIQDAFISAARAFIAQLGGAQEVLGITFSKGSVHLCDVVKNVPSDTQCKYDAALTSPPYAMALPYIDTQRLSLVWLNLISPDDILPLEARLIGSREMRGNDKVAYCNIVESNQFDIPEEQYQFCRTLKKRIGTNDGFRRKAVPGLLYRYFANMRDSFSNVSSMLKPEAPYALIVGHNHTVLGSVRQDIDTPKHLASLAQQVGWKIDEMIDLQTYRRYGYHMGNAVSAETLILLRNK